MKADVAEGKQPGNTYVDPTETEDYWETKQGQADQFVYLKDDKEAVEAGKIEIAEGGAAAVIGFFEDEEGKTAYDTTDTVTYLSLNESVATVDKDGVITAVGKEKDHTSILVMVNGKKISTFDVTITAGSTTAIVEADTVYVKNANGYTVDGTYVTKTSEGKANSLAGLGDAKNVKSVKLKNADGSKLKELGEVTNVKGVLYFADANTNTVYYVITSEEGVGSFTVAGVNVTVLDMEQFKANRVIPTGTIKFEMNGVKATSKTPAGKPVYVTEGTTFALSDILKVEGVTNPTITVTNDDEGSKAQNVSYDALTKTFTVNELTEENSGKDEDDEDKNAETITFTYEVSKDDKRTVSVEFITVKPALEANPYEQGFTDINGSTIFVEKDKMTTVNLAGLAKPVYAINADNKDGSTNLTDAITPTEAGKITSSNEKIVAIDEKTGEITVAKNYKAEAGDTVTLTYTFEQGQTVSYTIEVVDTLPTPVENGLGTNKFEYPDNNKQGQMISFNNIVKTDVALPAGCELVVDVDAATSGNVTYMKDGKPENNNGTVDATGIQLTATGNNRYTLEGIEVGPAENVAANTQITFTVSVVDADGNVISKSANITVYIVGGDEAVPEINLNSVKLTAKDGTDNKVATYSYTPVEGWELQNTAATDIKVDGGTVAVTGNNTITLTLTDPYISETEKTTTATLTFKKGDVIKTKDVTLKYTGDVEDTKDLNIALTNDTAAFDSAEATSVTYTLDTAKMNGWTLKEQTVTLADGTDATVTANGDTITLTFKGAPIGDGSTSPVSLTLTKAGQNEINKEVTLNYTAFKVAP